MEELQEDMEKMDLADVHRTHEDVEKIERALFEGGRNLISHQIRSFEQFMGEKLQSLILQEFEEVEVLPNYSASSSSHRQKHKQAHEPKHGWRRAKLSFQRVHITKPEWASQDGQVKPLFPHEARFLKLTYSAEVKVDVHIKVYKPCDIGLMGKGKEKYSMSANKGEGKQSMASSSFVGEEIEQDELLKNVSIGRIPVMVHSSYCQMHGLSKEASLHKGHCLFDVGGYFIINGSEKVLITQEEKVRSLRCIHLQNDKGFQARMPLLNKGLTLRSSHVMINLKYQIVKEKRKGYQQKIPYITAQIPFIKNEINVIILFRALGITNDEQLMDITCMNLDDTHMFELIRPSMEAADADMLPLLWNSVTEQRSYSSANVKDAALNILGSKLKNKIEETPSETLERCLFPDLIHKDRTKAAYLGYMVAQVMAYSLGRRREDRNECLSKKRLDLAGDLLLKELKSKLFKFRKELQNGLQKLLVNNATIDLQKQIKPISLEHAFSTGNWAHPPENKAARTGGIVVPLDRGNPSATLSHLRQTELQADPKSKLREARYPNMSYIGRLCLVQSPDGEKCGLVKSLALSSHVTSGSPEKAVVDILKQLKAIFLEDAPLGRLRSMSKIFLNGQWLAVHECWSLAKSLRLLRRTMNLHFEVEIAEDVAQREVRICCDAGRILRPLIILREKWQSDFRLELKQRLNSQVKWTVTELLEAGIIEYVGPEEEAGCIVAADLDDVRENGGSKHFTHCEIHPSLMFGLSGSLIPFANHNHTSRVMHQAQKHCRQAIGHYTTCLWSRPDTAGQNLLYPQRPLVSTKFSRLLNRDELANGQNAILAVCPFLGFNQEDSLVMNQSSIDRGLFNTIHYRGFSTVYDQSEETMMKPTELDARRSNRRYDAYNKLDDDGLPRIGANCRPRDILFGKVSTLPTNAFFQDRSIELKSCEKGRVDRVILSSDGQSKTIARVFLREKRIPVVGDKFSSMHGQKGVVGLILPQFDLPFTGQGIAPDIIINPNAFPSRQTVGQLLECHFSKATAIKGSKFDGTPYTHKPLDFIRKELHQLGFNEWGNEVMVHGQTGARIDASIFIGPAFYQRLTKMAHDQVKYRRQGPTHPLTRQPVDDRKRHGGIRIGEMERDCLLGHGVGSTIQERLFFLSDPYQVHICQECHTMVTKDGEKHTRTCRFCRTSKNIVCVDVPYACKLLYQELLSMGIFMRIKTELD